MNDAEFGAKVMRLVLLVNSVRTAMPQSFAEAEIVRDCQTAIGLSGDHGIPSWPIEAGPVSIPPMKILPA